MKLAIITSGFLPVPASKGGAVENLIVNFMKKNEEYNDFQVTVFSNYDKKANDMAKNYNNSKFVYVKSNLIVEAMDRIIFFIAKNIIKKENSHSYRYIFKRLHFLNKVSINLKKENYDKILLENHPTQYLALKWRNNFQKYQGKYYYHCHNEFPGSYGCYNIMSGTSKFISVSKFRENTIKEYLKLDESKYCVVRNCVDSSKINKKCSLREREELLKKYDIGKDDIVIIFTGRVVPGKGIKEILSSLKMVKSKNYKLLLLGASLNGLGTKTNFEKEIIDITKGLEDRVIFTGFINYDDLYKYYSIADFAVLPSIMEDSAPLTIIEALSCGLPIITTDSGGIPEYVNEKCAIMIKRDEKIVENLSINIDKLIKNIDIREKMKAESLLVARELSMDKYYKNMIRSMNMEESLNE